MGIMRYGQRSFESQIYKIDHPIISFVTIQKSLLQKIQNYLIFNQIFLPYLSITFVAGKFKVLFLKKYIPFFSVESTSIFHVDNHNYFHSTPLQIFVSN